MKVIVDFDVCESNGICMETAPEVFRLDDEDYLHVLQENPSEDLYDAVEQAAVRCPKQAITIED
ncbi:ferredoxin [Blastococcus sp. Marseille-P5729]|uniref:ferredoxin n=1 Tax=Blastococcus sp. Marseille-P5729 TaxID=2086582 RepID=UPI000D0FDA2D|nr:ferredoxin [Blastococcus sp. Marseille-P5729]